MSTEQEQPSTMTADGVRPTARAVVARVEDVPPGSRILVEVNGRQIGIFNDNGRFHALLNRCPHQGGDLCRGDVRSHVESDGPGDHRLVEGRRLIACPWHGWEFDLNTGQSYFDPKRIRTRTFQTEVESGEEVRRDLDDGLARSARGTYAAAGLVQGPYVAEVIQVTIEDQYLVLLMRR